MLGAKDFKVDPYATVRQFIKLPPERRKTFMYETPSDTHFRKATCKEAAERGECNHYAKGFAVPVEPHQDLEGIKAKFTASGYTFMEGEAPFHLISQYQPGTKWLVFPPEQRCLQSYKSPHRIPLDHDPIVSIQGGDFRYYTGERSNLDMDTWVDALQESTQKLHDEIEKG